MTDTIESSFQGYIASTHDALLVFECVRRGVMPKVKRRLRDDERKLIRSGQVFVFDEKESGIKRWTDGLLWSPSRILFNFLVYRQVEKKAPVVKGSNPSPLPISEFQQNQLTSPQLDQNAHLAGALDQTNPLALGAIGYPDSSFTSISENSKANLISEQNRMRSASGASDTYTGWESLSMLDGFNMAPSTSNSNLQPGLSTQNDPNSERSLVGSLTTSYPFAKGGLCKKTISIQVENSTQHLISYYTVEDVRSGRLRTPSSLPEIASLSISPVFLTRTLFRFPPSIRYGLDGIPRFDGEDESLMSPRRLDNESSGEGTSSGSEAQQFRRQHQARPHSMQGHSRGKSLSGISRGRAMTLAGQGHPQRQMMVSSASQPLIRPAPLPHQIGGSGSMSSSRRMSDAASRTSRNRYEPYPSGSMGIPISEMQQHGRVPEEVGQMGFHEGSMGMNFMGSDGNPRGMNISPSPNGTAVVPIFAQQQQGDYVHQAYQEARMNPSVFSTIADGSSHPSSPIHFQHSSTLNATNPSVLPFARPPLPTHNSMVAQLQEQQRQSTFQDLAFNQNERQQQQLQNISTDRRGVFHSSRPSSHSGLPMSPSNPVSPLRGQTLRPLTAVAQLERSIVNQDTMVSSILQDRDGQQPMGTPHWGFNNSQADTNLASPMQGQTMNSLESFPGSIQSSQMHSVQQQPYPPIQPSTHSTSHMNDQPWQSNSLPDDRGIQIGFQFASTDPAVGLQASSMPTQSPLSPFQQQSTGPQTHSFSNETQNPFQYQHDTKSAAAAAAAAGNVESVKIEQQANYGNLINTQSIQASGMPANPMTQSFSNVSQYEGEGDLTNSGMASLSEEKKGFFTKQLPSQSQHFQQKQQIHHHHHQYHHQQHPAQQQFQYQNQHQGQQERQAQQSQSLPLPQSQLPQQQPQLSQQQQSIHPLDSQRPNQSPNPGLTSIFLARPAQ